MVIFFRYNQFSSYQSEVLVDFHIFPEHEAYEVPDTQAPVGSEVVVAKLPWSSFCDTCSIARVVVDFREWLPPATSGETDHGHGEETGRR